MGIDAALSPQRILVVLPNWVGDVVLASPTLAALRAHFRPARITYLMRKYVADVVAGCNWHDDEVYWPATKGINGTLAPFRCAAELRKYRFDLAILLTNSFKSALAVWQGGALRRVGYAREARGWMLTDRLIPLKRDGEFVPASVLPYYAKLAEHVGCSVSDRALRLGIAAEQQSAGETLRRHYQLDDRPYAIINPGAAFGASKCWLPERFAELCDRLQDELGLIGVLVGAPGEMSLLRKIAAMARRPLVFCENPGTTLGSLKELVRTARLLVCNDTGPRHYGNAFQVPTVTIFGPTHQEWTDTEYTREIKLQERVECGPCQLPVCPLDHRCMTQMTTDSVLGAARRLLDSRHVGMPLPVLSAGG